MSTPKWVQVTRNKLNSTINKYNKNLAPLGLRIKKYLNPNRFNIEYGNGNRKSIIGVDVNPYLLSANLARGHTHPNNREKGIALALRTFATVLLRNAGYVKIRHQGVNFQNRNNASRAKTGSLPISTHIVRKHLGFTRLGNASNHRSIWRNTPDRLAKLKNAERLSRNKLKALLN
jgi:hypothetical protein